MASCGTGFRCRVHPIGKLDTFSIEMLHAATAAPTLERFVAELVLPHATTPMATASRRGFSPSACRRCATSCTPARATSARPKLRRVGGRIEVSLDHLFG